MRRSPTGLLLDTGLFIAAERGRFDLEALLVQRPDLPHAMSSITAAELLVGVERSLAMAHVENKRATVEEFLTTFAVLEFDLFCARRWAKIAADLQKKGQLIGAHDLLIAATALRYGYAVATFNIREFSRIPGLVTIPLTTIA